MSTDGELLRADDVNAQRWKVPNLSLRVFVEQGDRGYYVCVLMPDSMANAESPTESVRLDNVCHGRLGPHITVSYAMPYRSDTSEGRDKDHQDIYKKLESSLHHGGDAPLHEDILLKYDDDWASDRKLFLHMDCTLFKMICSLQDEVQTISPEVKEHDLPRPHLTMDAANMDFSVILSPPIATDSFSYVEMKINTGMM